MVHEQRGAYVLETALLLPLLCVLTLAIVCGALVSWQHVSLYFSVTQGVHRVTTQWGNSMRDPHTGMFTPYAMDPLYRRWTSEGAAVWFGMHDTAGAVRQTLPPTALPTTLLAKKMARAAVSWPRGIRGTATFSTHGLWSTVDVHGTMQQRFPFILGWHPARAQQQRSQKTILDPTEWIRYVSWVSHVVEIMPWATFAAQLREKIRPWLPLQGTIHAEQPTLAFRHHAEAAKAIRAWVRGTQQRRNTQTVGQWRLIDALDAHNVAHQVYIGEKTTDAELLAQMRKDIELRTRGEIHGVVWHFVRRTGVAQYGPTEALKTTLYQQGILYVIHP